jgi:ABC-type nitrate/sulfonate/bicarbonate transport system permease component
LAAAGVITGLRASLQISLIIMVISEMLGSPIGLGAFLVHAQNLFDVYNLWMAIIILGTIGLLLNLVFDASVKRYFPWYQRLDKSLNDF